MLPRLQLGLLLAVLACTLALPTYAAVIGIDFGTDSIVVSTPGRLDGGGAAYDTINIVLNEQSLRKTPSFVGFRNGERFFGAEAQALAARFPDLMVPMAQRLVGVRPSDLAVTRLVKGMHLPITLNEHAPRGTVDVPFALGGAGGTAARYTADELVAMLFGAIKRMAERDHPRHETVTAAVVTVPVFFSDRQRQAVVDAAAIAGVRVLSLMHATTAAALLQGLQHHGFGEAAPVTAFIDMGATSTHVGVYAYSGVPPPSRRTKLSASLGNVTALAVVGGAFGGRTLDACIARIIEEEFVATGIPAVLGGADAHRRKASVALLRAANKVKEMLSVNRVAPYTVEGVAPERDYSGKMTRERFEERCVGDMSAAVAALLDTALQRAGAARGDGAALLPAKLDRVEVIGGGMRVPKLLADTEAHLFASAKGRTLDRTMNGDEAAATGAGYRAAMLSGVMRFAGLAVQDATALGHSAAVALLPDDAEDSTEQANRPLPSVPLFHAEKRLPAERTVTFGPDVVADVRLALLATRATAAATGQVSRDAVVTLSGLRAVLDKLNYFSAFQREHNATHHTRIVFVASESGIVNVHTAAVAVTYAVNESVTPPPVVNATANDTEAAPPVPETRVVMRRRVFPLEVRLEPVGAPLPLDAAEADQSRQVIAALRRRDEAAQALSAAKNDLETYLVWARSGGADTLLSLLAAPEAEALTAAVRSASAWLEDDATVETTMADYEQRLLTVRRLFRAHAAALDTRAPEHAPSMPASEPDVGPMDADDGAAAPPLNESPPTAPEDGSDEPAAEGAADEE